MVTCKQCGQTMKRITTRHIEACRIPLPNMLAQEWIDNPILTTKELAHNYDVHADFMRIRLSLGGIPTEVQANRGYKIRRLNWGMTENETPTIPQNKHQCEGCGIIIDRIMTHCSFCIKELHPICQGDIEHGIKEIA